MIKKMVVFTEFIDSGYNMSVETFDEDGRKIKVTTQEVQKALLTMICGMTSALIENRFTHEPVLMAEDEE